MTSGPGQVMVQMPVMDYNQAPYPYPQQQQQPQPQQHPEQSQTSTPCKLFFIWSRYYLLPTHTNIL